MPVELDGHRKANWAVQLMSWEWDIYVQKQSSGGLLRLGYNLFKKQESDYELADSVSEGMKQLKKDWNFLTGLMEAMLDWSDAAELLQQSGKDSVLQSIDACGNEITGCVKACDYGKKYITDRPKKFSILLSECRRVTDALLKQETVGVSAMEHISSLPFKPKTPYLFSGWGFERPLYGGGWDLSTNLNSMMDAGSLGKHSGIIRDELKLIELYLYRVKDWKLRPKAVDAFNTHVESVVARIAIQSCHFWFNRKDANIMRARASGLVNLQHEIDPSNPEFMKLILEFQFIEANEKPSGSEESGTYFCKYILPSCTNKDIKEQLMFLARLFLTTTLRSRSYHEDVRCFFAEVLDMFAEAAWLHRTCHENETDNLHSCSYLFNRICLLEVEFYLKEQLSIITINNSLPFSERQILKVEVCQRWGAECEKQTILVRESVTCLLNFN